MTDTYPDPSPFDLDPEPAVVPTRRARRRWLAPRPVPLLETTVGVALHEIPIGTVVALEGRPPTVVADPRFEPARRVPLARFGARFAAVDAEAPDPSRYFALGVLALELDAAEAALSEPPTRVASLPWVCAPSVHAWLAQPTHRALRELGLPLVPVTDSIGAPSPVAPTPRFAQAAAAVEEVLLRADSRVVLLHGPSGVGKSAFLRFLAGRVRGGLVAGPLRGLTLVAVDPAALDGGHHPDLEVARNAALQRLAGLDVVVVVDEAHRLFRSVNGRNDAVDQLKLLASEHGLRLVLATNESSRVIGDEAWDRRQTPVQLPEATAAELLEHVLPARAAGAEARGVTVTVAAQREILARSGHLDTHAQPHAAVSLLERAVARALRLGRSSVEPSVVEELALELSGRARAAGGGCHSTLRARVVGHDAVVEQLARWWTAHERRRARLRGAPDPRPFTVLLAGPPGVGKSELARALAAVAAGGDADLFVIRGGDFNHESHVNRLVGAPPSYVGFGGGGELFRWVKRREGHGVIELAEPERGSVQLLERVVLPLLDGSLTSNEGDSVLTRGLALVITTNVGTERHGIGFASDERARERSELAAELRRLLPQPVLSRIGGRILALRPLGSADLGALVRRWSVELGEREGLAVTLDDVAVQQLVASTPGTSTLGARALRAAFEDRVVSPIEELLLREPRARALRITTDDDGDLTCTAELEP